ncbi:alpha/beta hydrolase [Ferdinandcohnia quinoae]|uniref:Alpha/beta hydrolase-fold protein n=1 Tax=Fredinandcohnia quinoae TaxID=2918902 RepID=A0AAW5E3L9_9BACI|nr:alpha/beta hydrolase-fold protein [Fredinandcohnia sp. SECRCQ15]MCH1624502.1 alpha/beta hydrolase-fold protein [Fredinandcohnia sp. SECRCQ15]
MNKIDQIFYSTKLNKSIKYTVLTASENIKDAYVLYVQDGMDYIELGGIEIAIKDLIKMNPQLTNHLVFVLIHPGSSIERWESFSRKGNSFINYIHFMNDEFIPKFEKTIENLHMKISKRGLLGDSLAGNICLNIAMEKPEIWTHLLLQSAAISVDDILQLEKVQPKWNVYQTVGLHEDDFISSISNEKLYILTRNRQLYESLSLKDVNLQYKEVEEHHLWRVWEEDLPNALRFFIET